MSERREKLTKTKRRLRVGGVLEGLGLRRRQPAETEEDLDAMYKQRQRERLDALPAGPGLKDYDLELDLFQYSTDMSELSSRGTEFFHTFDSLIKDYKRSRGVQGGYYDDSAEHPFEALIYSSIVQSRSTPELSQWLQERVPQNGYFTPEMIAEALGEQADVSVRHEVAEGIETWTFANEEGETFTLSRPQDGQRPGVRTKPYLAAHYSTEYDFDTDEVVASPALWLNGSDSGERGALRGSLGERLKGALGLAPVRMAQKVEFRMEGAKPMPYFTGAGTDSLESITAQAHVIADLPHEEAV